jgi:predicted metal-binding membrane protein
MIGMMTPSATPMVLLYARVGRHAEQEGQPFAAVGWFLGGYLLAWTAFAFAATYAQWAIERAGLLTPMMGGANDAFGAAVLFAAGLYQWTPLKNVCLRQCQAPWLFIQRHGGFRRDGAGSLALGARHGTYCVGCCWALMALLFFGGVMNLLWIAAIAIFVLAEKIIPAGRAVAQVAGVAFLAGGAWLLTTALR